MRRSFSPALDCLCCWEIIQIQEGAGDEVVLRWGAEASGNNELWTLQTVSLQVAQGRLRSDSGTSWALNTDLKTNQDFTREAGNYTKRRREPRRYTLRPGTLGHIVGSTPPAIASSYDLAVTGPEAFRSHSALNRFDGRVFSLGR